MLLANVMIQVIYMTCSWQVIVYLILFSPLDMEGFGYTMTSATKGMHIPLNPIRLLGALSASCKPHWRVTCDQTDFPSHPVDWPEVSGIETVAGLLFQDDLAF